MAFEILLVCPVGDELDDPNNPKQPLSKKMALDAFPALPRAGDAITTTFGMAKISAEVTGVHFMLVDDVSQGVVINLRRVTT